MNQDINLTDYDEDDYELVTDQIELSDYYELGEEF
jgi:hypothetical protein